jgi:hypothetical protein
MTGNALRCGAVRPLVLDAAGVRVDQAFIAARGRWTPTSMAVYMTNTRQAESLHDVRGADGIAEEQHAPVAAGRGGE